MRLHVRSVLLLAIACCVIASMAQAVPFEPVFRLMKVTGEVTVKAPGAGQFKEAEEGKAYPYGTAVRTGKRAAVIVVYAANNTCQVGPLANLMVEAASILLDAGKVEIVLEEGNALAVTTPCASSESVGGAFTIEMKSEAELKIAVYTCTAGELAILSDMFQVPALDANDLLSVSCAQDQSFIRLKDIQGKFDVFFTDDSGTPRSEAMERNSVVKIWRRKADTSDAIVVTILLVKPDGTLGEAINYTIKPEPKVAVVAPDQPPLPVVGGDDDDDDDDDAGEKEELEDVLDDDPSWFNSTSTSTTTTTSTMPDVTPTGLR